MCANHPGARIQSPELWGEGPYVSKEFWYRSGEYTQQEWYMSNSTHVGNCADLIVVDWMMGGGQLATKPFFEILPTDYIGTFNLGGRDLAVSAPALDSGKALFQSFSYLLCSQEFFFECCRTCHCICLLTFWKPLTVRKYHRELLSLTYSSIYKFIVDVNNLFQLPPW